jgi:hypothetical protein
VAAAQVTLPTMQQKVSTPNIHILQQLKLHMLSWPRLCNAAATAGATPCMLFLLHTPLTFLLASS